MASAFPAPPLAPHRSPFASHRTHDTSTTSASTAATPSSLRTSAGGRKRARNESPTRDWQDLGSSTGSLWGAGGPSPGFFNDAGETPVVISPGAAASPGFFPSAGASPSFASPAPLANSRYRLAGGEATPSLAQSATSDFFAYSPSSMGNSISDLSYRRGRPYHDERSRSASGFSTGLSSYSERLPTALSRESNGRPRALPSTDSLSQSSTLTTSVLQTVSGMFGAVWNFCTAGSFSGFFAGGGKGYAMDAPRRESNEQADDMQYIEPLPTPSSIWQDVDINMASSIDLPGGFPESPDSQTSTPAPKKVKRAHFQDDPTRSASSLTQSWIVVRDTASPAVRRKIGSSTSTASPASMRQSPAAAPTVRPALRRSSGTSVHAKLGSSVGSGGGAHHRTASAAGLRSPTRSPMHSRQNSHVVDKKAVATTEDRVSLEREEEQSESPIVTETARFVKDMRRMERREDRDIKRMNRALEDMIREAREALGTTVEVEMLGHGREEDLW